jgi:carbonic anhydrase
MNFLKKLRIWQMMALAAGIPLAAAGSQVFLQPAMAASGAHHGDSVAAKSSAHESESKTHKPQVHRASSVPSKAYGSPHWTYKGAAGPTAWGRISKTFRLCEAGRMQSPINIDEPGSEKASIQAIKFDYHPVLLDIVHNGHTVQVNYAPGSSITISGKRYDLLQFHFHTPSEHAVSGKRAPYGSPFRPSKRTGQAGRRRRLAGGRR